MRNYTPNAKAALMLAERFAKRMHQGYVGCEHILLGLVEEGSGTASVVLQENGVECACVKIMDRGALDCVIRARVETAVLRGKEA